MTLEAQAFQLCERFEQAVRHAQSPGEVTYLREQIGEAIELLRTVGALALQQEAALSVQREQHYNRALKMASDPRVAWPPPVRVVKVQPGERA